CACGQCAGVTRCSSIRSRSDYRDRRARKARRATQATRGREVCPGPSSSLTSTQCDALSGKRDRARAVETSVGRIECILKTSHYVRSVRAEARRTTAGGHELGDGLLIPQPRSKLAGFFVEGTPDE